MRPMTWTTVAVFAIALIGASRAGAQGFDDVLRTKHNVFPEGASTPMAEVCGACHSEGEPTGRAPAWDAKTSIKTYLPLPRPARTEIRTGKGGRDLLPFGPSFDCLTCHDGVLGADVHQLGLVSGGDARATEMQSLAAGRRSPDHPDSVAYPRRPDGKIASQSTDPSLLRYWTIPDRDDTGITLPTGPVSTNLNLQNIDISDPNQTSGLVRTFMGVIHCDTCHNPHVNANRPFLRLPAKEICLACHQR